MIATRGMVGGEVRRPEVGKTAMVANRSLGAVARGALKDVSVLADRVRPPGPGITILLYHRVGVGSGSVIDLDLPEFERQMELLASEYRVISLDQAAEELVGSASVEPGVVITFDDGTVDFVEGALPIMADHDVPSTLYVATGFVDGDRGWPDGGRPITRSGLAEVAASGLVTLGSHTHNHKLLDRLPDDELAAELDQSIELLGEWCGVTADHFAYPKAVAPSSAAASAVAARFRTAALADPGANVPGHDLQRLRRTPIQSSDGPRHLAAKFAGGMALESRLRSLLNRARYRGRAD